jgi:hypothetical protein
MLPIVTFAYEEEVPTKSSKPIANRKYNPETTKPITLDLDGLTHKRFCPPYT